MPLSLNAAHATAEEAVQPWEENISNSKKIRDHKAWFDWQTGETTPSANQIMSCDGKLESQIRNPSV